MGHRAEGEIVVSRSDPKDDPLGELFPDGPTQAARRYTLDVEDGELVFRLTGFNAIWESVFNEWAGKPCDGEDYNTVVMTDVGPKRFFNVRSDRSDGAGDFMREFFGRT